MTDSHDRPYDSLPYELNRLLLHVALFFGALFAYWEAAEAAQLGQQYSDPLLPCTWMAVMFGGVTFHVDALVRTIRWKRAHR